MKMVHFSPCWRLKEFHIQVYSKIKTWFTRIFLSQFSLLTISFYYSIEGPGVMASKICMDKVATSVALKHVR